MNTASNEYLNQIQEQIDYPVDNHEVICNENEAEITKSMRLLVMNGLIVAAKDYEKAYRKHNQAMMDTIINELSDDSDEAGWLVKACRTLFPKLLPDVIIALKQHPETLRQNLQKNISHINSLSAETRKNI